MTEEWAKRMAPCDEGVTPSAGGLDELMARPSARVPLRLRELREARGWSASELARRVGRDQPWVSRVEAGVQTPSLHNAVVLAETLGCTLDALCGRPERDIDAEWRAKIAAILNT